MQVVFLVPEGNAVKPAYRASQNLTGHLSQPFCARRIVIPAYSQKSGLKLAETSKIGILNHFPLYQLTIRLKSAENGVLYYFDPEQIGLLQSGQDLDIIAELEGFVV